MSPCFACKFEFDEELGRYGCPNCHGEGLTHPPKGTTPMTETRFLTFWRLVDGIRAASGLTPLTFGEIHALWLAR